MPPASGVLLYAYTCGRRVSIDNIQHVASSTYLDYNETGFNLQFYLTFG